jgi:hypothetical protein
MARQAAKRKAEEEKPTGVELGHNVWATLDGTFNEDDLKRVERKPRARTCARRGGLSDGESGQTGQA